MTKTSAASLITPAQAADMLGVSTATLRRYATQFKKHLSKYAKAKRRQYTQSDLATLVKARDYVRGGNNTERTNILLGTITPGDEPLLPATAMSHAELVSSVETARDQLRTVGEQFAVMQETQTANSEAILALMAYNGAQIAALTARLDALQARSFVDRLLNRIPATA
jgi:DNA-binding transcriptional MerR regulator